MDENNPIFTEKYDYIIAFYLGQRRNVLYKDIPNTDKYFFIEKHLEFISNNLSELGNLNKVYLIGNIPTAEEFVPIYKDINKLVKLYNLEHIVDCDLKPNSGLSYGAWEYTLIKNLSNNTPKYAFLCEDDYIPTVSDFHVPFYKKFDNENVGYVTSLFWYHVNPPHAAISNGFIGYDVCRKLYDEFNMIFDLPSRSAFGYNDAGRNQVTFLNYLNKRNYSVVDISEECTIPYLDLNVKTAKHMVTNYGKENGKIVIKPITSLQKVEISKLTEDDLEFLCEVRNDCAPDYLHTSETYTLEQTIEWFNKTSPMFYLIKKNGNRIGYFRTSNYSEDNKNIYIGADLHSDYRGKGLGYTSYAQFIPYLFNSLKLNKISLEVLSTNMNAIKLYKKLGFVEEGIKRQEVYKNGKWVDSIVMSMLKTECFF